MNDFSEIEAELKKLRPTAASRELAARLEAALATSAATAAVLSRKRRFDLNWWSLGIGLAAAAVLFLLARVETTQPQRQQQVARAAAPDVMQRTRLTEVIYNTRDEGLMFPAGSSQPLRRLRRESRETLQWQNPGTGASLRVSYPREEVMYIPVSGQ